MKVPIPDLTIGKYYYFISATGALEWGELKEINPYKLHESILIQDTSGFVHEVHPEDIRE